MPQRKQKPTRRFAAGRPSPALTISVIALFVATASSGYAVTRVPHNSVGSKQLKHNSVTNSKIRKAAVTGSKIAKNTILGTNILESSLSKVPDADRLDGFDSSSFEQSGKFRRIALFSLGNGENREIMALGPLRLSAKCKINVAGQDDAQIIVSTTLDHSTFDSASASSPDFGPATPENNRLFAHSSGAPTGTQAIKAETAGMAAAPDGSQFVSQLWTGINVLAQVGRCQFGGLIEQVS